MNYRYLLSTLLSLGASFLFRDAFGFPIPFYTLLLTGLIVTGFVWLFARYGKNAVFYLTLEGIAFVFLLVNYFVPIPYLAFTQALANWWREGLPKNDSALAYPLATTVLLMAATSAFAYLLHRRFLVRLFTSATLAFSLFYLGFREFAFSLPGVFSLLSYCFLVFYEAMRKYGFPNADDAPSPCAVTTHLAPVLLLTVLLACLLPHSDEPIQWTFVKNAYYCMRDYLESIPSKWGTVMGTNPQEFALKMTGYSDNANLGGGGISDSERTALSLFTAARPNGSLYLNGSVWDSYTGETWENQLERKDSHWDSLLDAYELLFFLLQYETPSDPLSWDLLEIKDLTLQFEEVSTKSLFHPSKTIGLNVPDSLAYSMRGDDLLFDRVRRTGTKYYFTYCNPHYANKRFIRFLQEQTADSVTRIPPSLGSTAYTNSYLRAHFKGLMEQLPERELPRLLDERRERIRQEYTGLPDSLPSRVVDLARSLTKGLDNDYDRMRALESYLNGLQYTKKPPVPPEGWDVVDYFLFETQQGYCTYFASSMAVMARCLGLASRYIQGYTTSFHNRYSTFSYHVASNRAHAWVEVYLDGVGWVPFEPTAGYDVVRYKEWESEDALPAKKKAQLPISLTPRYEEEDGESETNGAQSKSPLPFVLVPTSSLSCIAGLLFLFWHAKKRRYDKRYRSANDGERYAWEFHRIFTALGALSLIPDQGECMTRYAERLSHPYPLFPKLCAGYLPVRYGNQSVKGDELLRAREFRLSLEEQVGKRLGRFRFRLYLFRIFTRPFKVGKGGTNETQY